MDVSLRLNGVTGHRGNPAAAPENTIESFENAILLGCDFIETDVRKTRDGRFMLCHDPDTLRTCGSQRLLAETDSAELRKLDASSDFNRRARNSFAVTRIPFLEEALELVRHHPDVRLSLQPKCPFVAEICKVVKKFGLADRIACNDGSLDYMKTAKQLLPEAVIFYDTHGAEQLEEAIRISAGLGFYSIVSYLDDLTPDRVRAIAAAGLEPGVWTVDDPAGIARFLDMGVYRFYSDVPGEVMRQKAERKAASLPK